MQLPAVLRKLYLRHDFYNTILKNNINYIQPLGQPPPQNKFWVRTWLSVYAADDGVREHKEQRTTEVR